MIRRRILEGGTFLARARFGYFSLAKERKVTCSALLSFEKYAEINRLQKIPLVYLIQGCVFHVSTGTKAFKHAW